jgi:hypothetical protein
MAASRIALRQDSNWREPSHPFYYYIPLLLEERASTPQKRGSKAKLFFGEVCVDEAQCEGAELIFSCRLPSCVCSFSFFFVAEA